MGALALRCGLAGLQMRPGAIYFPTPCRIDSLAMGAFVAVLARKPAGLAGLLPIARRLFAVTGLLLLGMFYWRNGLRFNELPSLTAGLTLLAALASSLLILGTAPSPNNWLRRLLENRGLRIFGQYSYGMYVLHHLFLPAFDRWLPTSRLVELVQWELAGALLHAALVIASTLMLACLSWHLLEKHFLKLKRFF